MKVHKKSPGQIITWANPTSHGELEVSVAVIGTQGVTNFPWDHNEIRGGHFAAAKKLAQQQGFDDVIEIGILRLGKGFLFQPVLNERKQNA